MVMPLFKQASPLYVSAAMAQQDFVASLLTLLGDTRLLFLPFAGDTTTSTDKSLNARTITHDATIAARLNALGLGYYTTYNGTSNYATMPDTANLSFGNGTADSAFAGVAVLNVTNTAAARRIVCKLEGDSTDQEWSFHIGSTDIAQVVLTDQSAGVSASRSSDAAITQGSFIVLGFTYSAATGGATAANDITIYENGLAKASTATNNASYVAMEDLTALGVIGALDGAAAGAPSGQEFAGSIAMVAICQTNLSASNHWAIYNLARSYFGI
jgi:hypothetical protein